MRIIAPKLGQKRGKGRGLCIGLGRAEDVEFFAMPLKGGFVIKRDFLAQFLRQHDAARIIERQRLGHGFVVIGHDAGLGRARFHPADARQKPRIGIGRPAFDEFLGGIAKGDMHPQHAAGGIFGIAVLQDTTKLDRDRDPAFSVHLVPAYAGELTFHGTLPFFCLVSAAFRPPGMETAD